jgi:hypothetical protein
MIKINSDNEHIEIQYEGTAMEVMSETWAILDGLRNNIGDGNMLTFIHGYLEHMEDEIKGAQND